MHQGLRVALSILPLMSGEESKIRCRRCDEVIHVEDESCPKCGKKIRKTTYLMAGLVVGLVIALASLTNPGDLGFFGVIGMIIVGTTGYLLYNKRRRKKQAAESDAEPSDVLSEDDLGL